MPTYEYRCPACQHDFEKFQRMSDEPVADCPECGAAAERRLSAGAGLIFKGSGFYITDYRSEGYRKDAKADGGSGSSAAGGEGKTSDKNAASPSSASGSASGSGSSSAATKEP